MATLTVETGAAAITLTVDGADPPQMVRSLPPQTAALAFDTSGTLTRRLAVSSDPAALTFSTASGSDDFLVRELLAGAGIELQVWDRSDPTGTMLETLRFREQKFEWVLSETGAIEVTLPRAYLNSVLAEEDHHIVVLVDGIERARFIAEDLVEVPLSEDERQSVKVVGRGIGASLEWGAVAPYDFGGPNQRVKRIWSGATRAQALFDIFGEIKARSALPQVTVDGWDGVHGSTGAVWADLVDLEFDAGGTYLALLDSWTEYGIEWTMTHDFRLQLAPSFGRNLASSVVIYPAHTARQQELSISRRDIRTRIFTQDGAGGVALIEDAVALDKWGHREQYAVFSDALGTGTATANGYLLLDLIKDAVKERRVEIDPNAPGRRPFVDFDLGDVVGVWFGDDVYEFRVLAIAMGADEDGRVRCEVTLEYMLEAQRRRRQRLLNSSTAGGGVASGPQTVYAIDGGVVVGTSPVSLAPLTLTAFVSTLGKCGFCVIGTCSTPQTVTVDLLYVEDVIESFKYTLPAGLQTVEATWLWTQIPQGQVPMRIRLSVDTGTFTVGSLKAQFWVEAKSIAGKQTQAPIFFMTEEVPPAESLIGVADSFDLWLPGLVSGAILTGGEDVPPADEMIAITDSFSEPVTFTVTAQTNGSDQDGWVNSGAITTNSAGTFVGDVGGESRSAFYRFAIPVDLTGKTIVDAYLLATGNAVSAAPVTRIRAIDAAAPTAPTTLAEYTGATLTTEGRDWLTATTNGGALQSPSIKNIVDELLASYGTVSSIVVMHQNNGSATNANNQFRSYDYGATAGVRLVIQYLEE